MYTAEHIAEWFIAWSAAENADGNDEQITNLKLQKLLYYAQGCVLALTGERLFSDEMEAWEHGPVVPAVYRHYKDNGKSGIEPEKPFDMKSVDDKTTEILKSVYETFGQFSAWKLRNMTHEETPWIETPKNHVISVESIKKYFEENYIEK